MTTDPRRPHDQPQPQPLAQLDPAPRHTVVLCGGGLTSTALTYWLVHHDATVTMLTCDFGNHPAHALQLAEATATHLRCHHRIADLSAVTALLGRTRPEDSGTVRSGTAPSAVSNAMAIMLDLAVALAIQHSADAVVIGAHGDDTVLRPDCDTPYLTAATQQAVLGSIALSSARFRMSAPFTTLSSGDVVRLGHQLGVPWQRTWSCHHDTPVHCGRCSGCRRRRGAFAAAQVTDPTRYHDPNDPTRAHDS